MHSWVAFLASHCHMLDDKCGSMSCDILRPSACDFPRTDCRWTPYIVVVDRECHLLRILSVDMERKFVAEVRMARPSMSWFLPSAATLQDRPHSTSRLRAAHFPA
jgi:hypothetical protein